MPGRRTRSEPRSAGSTASTTAAAPITTRTVFNRNHVIAFLEDIYTPVERTLINAGEHDAVKYTRQVFQMAMENNSATPWKRSPAAR